MRCNQFYYVNRLARFIYPRVMSSNSKNMLGSFMVADSCFDVNHIQEKIQ